MPSGEETDGGKARREARGDTRARILETAYQLFSHHGIRSVGVDRIIAESGVAKKTFYRHFASKQALALAFLALREQRWTRDWLQAEMDRRGDTPRERLLAVFDALDEWFHRSDYEGCSFQNTLLEIHEDADPVHQEAAHRLSNVRSTLEDEARQAGSADPARTANQLQILMLGAITSAGRGDHRAALDARQLAELLLNTIDPGEDR